MTVMVPFCGGGIGGSRANSNGIALTRNLYEEVINREQDKVKTKLVGTAGTVTAIDFSASPYSNSGVMRGVYTSSWGTLYVVVGYALYSVDTNTNVATLLGSLSVGSNQVSITDNGWHLVITDGQLMWSMKPDGTELKNVILELFSNPNIVRSIGGRILCQNNDQTNGEAGSDPALQPITRNCNRIYYSSLGADGANDWTLASGAGWFVAEQAADAIVGLETIRNEITLFGSRSVEFWRPTGDAVSPFEFAQGAGSNIGCNKPRSIGTANDSALWWATDGGVYMLNGYNATRVSTPAEEFVFANSGNLSDISFGTYEQEGHTFAVWTSVQAHITFCLDVSLIGVTECPWSLRSSKDFTTHVEKEWDYLSFSNTNGKVVACAISKPVLCYLNLSKYTEFDGRVISRKRVSPVYWDALKPMAIRQVIIDLESGVGLQSNNQQTGTGIDPVANIRASLDGGHSWGRVRNARIGTMGNYGQLCMVTCLGMGRSAMLDVEISDPIKTVILGCRLSLEKGEL